MQVFGGDERIGALTDKVSMGDTLQIGTLNVRCLFTPCHTTGHICYLVEEDGSAPAVFTGDTLFIAGCGRFFEGTAEQMNVALNEILSALPDETKVFCGHEYTLQNLAFAKHVEPDNVDVNKRIEWAQHMRAAKLPTVPSTIRDEKLTNPFMRVTASAVQDHSKKSDPISVMQSLRNEKDNFKAN